MKIDLHLFFVLVCAAVAFAVGGLLGVLALGIGMVIHAVLNPKE